LGGGIGGAANTIYRNAFLTYNPAARGLDGERITGIDRAAAILRHAGHGVETVPTEGPGSAAGIVAACIRGGADLILVAGGDGTINEVVNGMIGEQVPLGILPAGTANVLATELGLTGNWIKVGRDVGRWVPRRIPAGRLTLGVEGSRRHFLMLAGVGLDAHIVRNVDPNLKKFQGKLSYWLAALGEFRRTLDEFEVLAAGSRFRASFALASRVRNYGATLELTRRAGLLRGDFELALFEGSNTFRYLEYLGSALSNRLDHTSGVSLLHVNSAEFLPLGDAPVFVQVDGELAGCLPARIDLIPDALALLCPPEYA
jgi:diacylglycerol kinase family enzyme